MIICKKCGHRNTDADQWCTNPACGAYLAFEGAKESGPGPTDPVADTLDQPLPGPAAAPTPSPAAPPPARPTAAAPTPPVTPPRSSGTEIPPIRPGEVVCPSCRWGNDPSRAFCRHCGAPLSGAGAPPSGESTMEWSDTEEPRRRWPMWLAAGLAAALFAGAGALAVHLFGNRGGDGNGGAASPTATGNPPAGEALDRKDFTVKASTSEHDAGAQYLTDGDPQSYWAAQPNGSDENTRLTFALKEEAKIVRLEVEAGGVEGQYQNRPRPASICIYVDGGDCQQRQLVDQAEPQEVQVDSDAPISELEMEIVTVYPARVGDNNRVAMREVTLFEEP